MTDTYIQQVYGVVVACVTSYFVGAFATTNYPGTTTKWIIFGICVILMIYVVIESKARIYHRLVAVMLVTFFLGWISAEPLNQIHDFDRSLIPTALVITISVFIGLTLTVFCFPSPLYQALSGPCFCCLTLLCFLSFFNSPWLWSIEIYGGVILFSLFILADTHLMLKDRLCKEKDGTPDVIFHAFNLSLDFINMFVRILGILIDLKIKKEEKDRRKKY